MILTILTQKYNCGCNRGISKAETPGLLEKLNKVIQWDKVIWPEKEENVPDKEFLGIPPQIAPGNTFLWDGNVMALDNENAVVLIVSETGPRSVERFVDILNNEVVFIEKSDEGLEVEELGWDDNIPIDMEEFRIGFSKYKPIKERCEDENWLRKRKIKILGVPMTTPILVPTTIYLDRQCIFYNPDEIDREVLEELSLIIYHWVIKKIK